jgi:DNA-binding transcriptional ArsR family regulator
MPKPDHEAAIAHIDDQLAKHGIVSFREVNGVAGSEVLGQRHLLSLDNKTARHVASLLESKTHVLREIMVVRGFRRGKVIGIGGRRNFTLSVVEKRVEPFIDLVRKGSAVSSGLNHPAVNALLDIDAQNWKVGSVRLHSGKKGTRLLEEMGLLQKERYKRYKRVESNERLFSVTDPELMERAIKAVRRALELRNE